MNGSSLLSDPSNLGPVSQVAAVKAGARTCVQAPSREILATWSGLEGEVGVMSTDFSGFWKWLQIAPSAYWIRSLALRQQLLTYLDKILWGKTGRWEILPAPSALSSEGLAMMSAVYQLRVSSLFAIFLWVLWTQTSLAFRVRCFGSPSLWWVFLKARVLDVGSKPFTPQGETRNWGVSSQLYGMVSREFMVRACLKPFLPILMWVFSHSSDM